MDNNGETAKIAAAKELRELLAGASFASIATADVATGSPYVSLVAIAESAGLPIMLLSGLARHTRNLVANPRASLLLAPAFAPPGGYHADPLTQARGTLIGSVVSSADDRDRDAFLGRHHAAAAYAGFGDFAFYRLEIDAAHFIGGFGRIIELTPAHLIAAGSSGR